MQMFDIYENREAYEDRVSQLKKDYDPSERKAIRKSINWVKKLFKRNEA
jgi:beta-glucosidase/6-phospho-beta-glucosidase/beta-galactosidase